MSTTPRSQHFKPVTHTTLLDLSGYGVTTSSTPEGTPSDCALIAELESYIRSYVSLPELASRTMGQQQR